MNFLQLVRRTWVESGKQGDGPATLTGTQPKDVTLLINAVSDAWIALERMQDRRWKWGRRRLQRTITTQRSFYSDADLAITDFSFWRRPSRDYSPMLAQAASPTTFGPLRFRELDAFRAYELTAPASSGQPTHWTIGDDGSLGLSPSPAVGCVLVVEYQASHTPLVGNDDEPTMPARHHMYLVWRALVEAGARSASPETLARAVANADAAFADLVSDQGDGFTMGNIPLA